MSSTNAVGCSLVSSPAKKSPLDWLQVVGLQSDCCCCRALNSCPVERARVIILGQDPYHNTGQAMGLSFSVPKGQPVPSSLKNIYSELKSDCGCTPPKHGDLQEVSRLHLPS